MNRDDFEALLRALECFHSLRLLPGVRAILRVDGQGFSRLSESRHEEPFDVRVAEANLRDIRA